MSCSEPDARNASIAVFPSIYNKAGGPIRSQRRNLRMHFHSARILGKFVAPSSAASACCRVLHHEHQHSLYSDENLLCMLPILRVWPVAARLGLIMAMFSQLCDLGLQDFGLGICVWVEAAGFSETLGAVPCLAAGVVALMAALRRNIHEQGSRYGLTTCFILDLVRPMPREPFISTACPEVEVWFLRVLVLHGYD